MLYIYHKGISFWYIIQVYLSESPPNNKIHKYSINLVKISKGIRTIMALRAPLGFTFLVSTLSVNSLR